MLSKLEQQISSGYPNFRNGNRPKTTFYLSLKSNWTFSKKKNLIQVNYYTCMKVTYAF